MGFHGTLFVHPETQESDPKIAVFATLQHLLAGYVKSNRSILTVNSPRGFIPGVSMSLQYFSFIVIL